MSKMNTPQTQTSKDDSNIKINNDTNTYAEGKFTPEGRYVGPRGTGGVTHSVSTNTSETRRGRMDNIRGTARTLQNTIGDIMDEGMKYMQDGNADVVLHLIKHSTEDSLQELIYHDSIPHGFKGLDQDGENNPLCDTYVNPERRADNKEYSEYGIGFTQSCPAASDLVMIPTRYEKKDKSMETVRITLDYQKQVKENTDKFDVASITEEEFKINSE